MKILLYGKEAGDLKPLLQDFSLVEKDPDVVISYGGDGTLLHAEHEYPGVPKLPLRNSNICKLCSDLPQEDIFTRLATGTYKINSVAKLETEYDSTAHWAMNDISITHTLPMHAIRYTIAINDKPYAHGREIVGDGIVVATPFGSGAYYRSITKGTFSTGIGLAFNNATEPVDHIVLREHDVITLTLTRGQAVASADVYEIVRLREGDSLHVRTSKQEKAQIISFGEEFRFWES